MERFYEQFTREKLYLHNVSTATFQAYDWAWKAFAPVLEGQDRISKSAIVPQIQVLSGRGVSPVSINTYLRSLNAFFRWLHAEGHADTLVRIPRLKESQAILPIFSEQQVRRLVKFSPASRTEKQIHALACLILDTGARIDEALSLSRETDVDLDNLLLKIRDGKGGKGRVVPFSAALRKHLFRHLKASKPSYGSLLFFAAQGEKIFQRNALRRFKRLCERVNITGVRCSFHTLRHTFATMYLRNGGDVFRLQRILGHSKLDMTRRYVQLQTEDLQAVHDRCSPLGRG